MDYRIFLNVLDLPLSDEESWEPIISYLEDHTDFGPTIGWDGDSAEFVMSTDRYDNAKEAIDACVEALNCAVDAMPNPRAFTIDRIETEHADAITRPRVLA